MIMKKEVRVQGVRFLDSVNFVARVNYRDYIGTYYPVGKYITVDTCYEVNSIKQTTFRIKIAISYKLEELLNNNLKNKVTNIKNKKDMKTKIENFLSELSTEIDVLNLIDIDNIDYNDAFYSIYQMIDDNGGFNIDVIYYSTAIEYLSENDPSLNESLGLASEMGYTLDNLNSELLASLLASQNVRNDFYELENEINDFFLELE